MFQMARVHTDPGAFGLQCIFFLETADLLVLQQETCCYAGVMSVNMQDTGG